MGIDDKSLFKGPIAWMASHSVTAHILMLIFLAGGFIMMSTIKQEVFPDYELDTVTITVDYPGASPEEVERGIILPIEEAIQEVDNIKEVNSTAREGSGTVIVEVITGENIERFANDIKNSVDRITSFPADAEDPKVVITSTKRYVISIALYGEISELVLMEYAELLRDRLLQNKDISQVELNNTKDFEIIVEIPQNTLRSYNLTLADVAAKIHQSAIELPAGAIKTSAGDILVRVQERRDFAKQFENINIITAPDGTKITLEEIAIIKDGFEEVDTHTSFNGERAILIDVYRIGDQTPIAVVDAVKSVLKEVREYLPEGLQIATRNDRSEMYRQRLDLMLSNGYLGFALVLILLAIFLEPKIAFWVSLGIPVAFLGSFLILYPVGISINMMSMFAFIISIGIVVDDAIVVSENIYQNRQKGEKWLTAAIKGTREVCVPVFFSVFTNIIAFIPLLFVPGTIGKTYKQIPIVVISIFIISLLESFFVLPSHLGHQQEKTKNKVMKWMVEKQSKFGSFFLHCTEKYYGTFLFKALKWRYLSVVCCITFFVITAGYVQSGRTGFELFPKIESDFSVATAVLPYGTPIEKTEKITSILIEEAKKIVAEYGDEKLSEGILAMITDGNTAEVRVYLTPPKIRTLSTAALTDMWREQVGSIPGLESLKFESDAGGPGRGAALTIELSHQNIDTLKEAGEDLANSLSFFPNAKDINDGYSPGKNQISFKVRPEAEAIGMRAQDIAQQIRHSYYGAEALRQLRGRYEVKVLVRLPRLEREQEFSLEEMIILTPSGLEMPLKNAVIFEKGRAYTNITRRDYRRVISATADVIPRSRVGEIISELNKDILPDLKDKYPGLMYSFQGSHADMQESVDALIKGLMWAMVAIFVSIAIPLNSFIQPIIIMVAIPFGIIGAVIGHIIMGYSLSVMSMFGIVAISGVVVTNSLVLIDLINKNIIAGMDTVTAIFQGGVQRFRPIMLTTLTTFFGLLPMIFETSRQARFMIPMAISLGFGVLIASMITLVLVPVLFLLADDAKKFLYNLKG